MAARLLDISISC